MPRTAPPAVRRLLVERAAEMLARREPVTVRSLVAGTGATTMAVYTHFGGVDGLWVAVRQEGFERLARRLSSVPTTADPVHDLAALGGAYSANALANPHLYRAMFDAASELSDPSVAQEGFDVLVDAARRAVDAGRFTAAPDDVAARYWIAGHGAATLVITGVLPPETFEAHSLPITEAIFCAAGDEPRRCRRSVRSGWRSQFRS